MKTIARPKHPPCDGLWWGGAGGEGADGVGRTSLFALPPRDPLLQGLSWQDLLISAEPMAAPRQGKGTSPEPRSLFGTTAWSS